MRPLLLSVIILLFAEGCITKEKCQDRFPPSVSTRDTLIIRDSVAFTYLPYFIPKDSIIFHDSIPCDVTFNFSQTQNNLTGSVKAIHGKITFKCAEDSLRAILKQRESFHSSNLISKEVKVKPVVEYLTHWYDPPCRCITIISLILLALWLGFKAKNLKSSW